MIFYLVPDKQKKNISPNVYLELGFALSQKKGENVYIITDNYKQADKSGYIPSDFKCYVLGELSSSGKANDFSLRNALANNIVEIAIDKNINSRN